MSLQTHTIRLILCSCGIALALACRAPETVVLQEGDPLPSFSLRDVTGTAWDGAALQGRVVLINFWAPWCKPCRTEMPSLQRLQNRCGSDTRIAILTVLYGGDMVPALDFMKSGGYSLPLAVDHDRTVAGRFGVTGVPETYIFDSRGHLRRKIIGPTRFDTPDFNRLLDSLLNETPAADSAP